MIDSAQTEMAQGKGIALEQISSVNDNMSRSHYHDYFELYFLDSGSRHQQLNGVAFDNIPGDIMLFAPLVMHHSYSDKDAPFSRVVIYFTPEMISDPVLLAAAKEGSGLYRPDPHLLHWIRRTIFDMLEEKDNSEEYHDTYLRSLLNLLLLKVLRTRHEKGSTQNKNRMQKIMAYIHSNYANPLSLPALASHFYISEYYMCREFRKATGRTIIQYIQQTRIMNAQRLFMETDLNVTQVSEQTGFASLTHFNRIFQQITGETPSAYRKHARELHKSSSSYRINHLQDQEKPG